MTEILASQNTIIRDLNANSDQVIGRLAERREDVVRFIQEAARHRRDLGRRAARTSRATSRSSTTSSPSCEPTLVELENLADEQTPLLTDLRAAGAGLNRLALNLPGFNGATDDSLDTPRRGLGGRRARRCAAAPTRSSSSPTAGKKAPVDRRDPRRPPPRPRRPASRGRDRRPGRRRHRPHRTTRRVSPTRRATPGLEGLLNYVYYQTGALNQYDQIGHLLHFSLYNVNTGPCGHFSSGRDPETGEPGLPAEDGGTTTNILEMDNCVGWLGPNQPGINEDLNLPKYDPSVCPNGTEPRARRGELCSPSDPASASARSGDRSVRAGRGSGSSDAAGTAAAPTRAAATPAAAERAERRRQRRRRGQRDGARRGPRRDPRPARRVDRGPARATSTACAAAAAGGRRPGGHRRTSSTSSFRTEPAMLTTTTSSRTSIGRLRAKESRR